MRILFDTNLVLDVLLAREPHVDAAARLMSLVDRGIVEGVLCATTITTIHYIGSKAVKRDQVSRQLADLIDVFAVAPVDRPILRAALGADFADFEDAVLHEAAKAAGAHAIVTRNVRDFRAADLPVFEPRELIAAIEAGDLG